MGKDGPQGLPFKQILALTFTNFSQGVMLTLPFTVAVYMVRQWLGEQGDERAAGRLTGMLAAAYSFAQCLTSFLWGVFSNRWGRRPVMLIGCAVSSGTLVWFGLAPNYTWAAVARAVGGLLNGIIGAWKCMIGESFDQLTQGLVMSYMSLAWGVGCIVGPTIGGLFSQHCTHWPAAPLCRPGELFAERPYLLPCMVAAAICTIALLLDLAWLQETLPSRGRKHRRQSSALSGAMRSSASTASLRSLAGSSWDSTNCHFANTGKSGVCESVRESQNLLGRWQRWSAKRNGYSQLDQQQQALGGDGLLPWHTSRNDLNSWASKSGQAADVGAAARFMPPCSCVALMRIPTGWREKQAGWVLDAQPSGAPPKTGAQQAVPAEPKQNHDAKLSQAKQQQQQQEERLSVQRVDSSWLLKSYKGAGEQEAGATDPQELECLGGQQQASNSMRPEADGTQQVQQLQQLRPRLGRLDSALDASAGGRCCKDAWTGPLPVAAVASGTSDSSSGSSEGDFACSNSSELFSQSLGSRKAEPSAGRTAHDAAFDCTARAVCHGSGGLPPSAPGSLHTHQHTCKCSAAPGAPFCHGNAPSGAQAETAWTLKAIHAPDAACPTPDAAAGDDDAYAADSEVEDVPWHKDAQVVLALLGYGACCLLFCALDELTPIFASAPVAEGGLGMAEHELAGPLVFSGACIIVYSTLAYPRLQRLMGTVPLARWGLVLSILCCALVPLPSIPAAAGAPRTAAALVYLSMLVKSVAGTSAFTGSMILVNTLPAPSQLGAVNGVGQTLASLVRGVGPALGGVLWGEALTLGLRGVQQFLPFAAVSVSALGALVVFLALRPPKSERSEDGGADYHAAAVEV